MAKLNSILAACDFSPDARKAVERAAMLCAADPARHGVVLHVVESSWLDGLKRLGRRPTGVDRSLTDDTTQALKELADGAAQRTGGRLEPQVHVGGVVDVIARQAEGCDLLVLGARGTHPLRDSMVGTTAERLIRQIPKPVLVVRTDPAAAYRRVVAGVDFSPNSEAAFVLGQAIAPDAELHLVHVADVPFEDQMRYSGISASLLGEYRIKARQEAEVQMNRWLERARASGASVQGVVEDAGHVPTRLIDKARELEADLIVVGKRGRSLTEALLLGSVTFHLLSGQCACDVLVTQ